ncbi:YceD family protein [Ottowia caeni]|uniref:YceD family protein n=1 Tax=Ottowia caeni TaxID=2870339 RepID=UPI001E5EC76D|nr:YceD family protein [Ottowia caeni]
MSKVFNPQRLDVAVFSQEEAHLSGRDSLGDYARLAKESDGPISELFLEWRATGERLRAVDGAVHPGLHLHAQAELPLTCQLCMGPVPVPVEVDRRFIFVADEEAAAALDDQSEDDVLVISAEFNLRELIEDELLMALPLVPRHEQCPEAPTLSVQDADFEAVQQDKPNPFAVLASLKDGKKSA